MKDTTSRRNFIAGISAAIASTCVSNDASFGETTVVKKKKLSTSSLSDELKDTAFHDELRKVEHSVAYDPHSRLLGRMITMYPYEFEEGNQKDMEVKAALRDFIQNNMLVPWRKDMSLLDRKLKIMSDLTYRMKATPCGSHMRVELRPMKPGSSIYCVKFAWTTNVESGKYWKVYSAVSLADDNELLERKLLRHG